MASTDKADVNPAILSWALKEAQHNRMNLDDLRKRFSFLEAWEKEHTRPTYNQLRQFTDAIGIPFGYFFLSEPPDLADNPITDFRTLKNKEISRISLNLRETIHTMQHRQEWLHDYLEFCGAQQPAFIGSIKLNDNPQEVALIIRKALALEEGWASKYSQQDNAFKELRSKVEELGITTVINGVVGNNTRRKLRPEEFRGFSLADNLAPLIFINGRDFDTAKMFTLAHELVHIWLETGGTCREIAESALPKQPGKHEMIIEQFCNKVAAEVLVPKNEIRKAWNQTIQVKHNTEKLAKRFKVSQDVIAYRAYACKLIGKEQLNKFEHARKKMLDGLSRSNSKKTASGGDFYNSQNYRIGRKFATRVVYAAKEGLVSFSDAYDLVGLNGSSFKEYAEEHLKIKL